MGVFCLENLVKWVFGSSISVGSYLFGGFSLMVETLLFLMLLDFITGIIAGGYEGKLSSKVGTKGILKKVMILFAVVLAHRIDILGLNDFTNGLLGVEGSAMFLIVLYFIGNEGLSVVENIGKVIELPSWLTRLFEVLKNKGEMNDENK